MGLALLSSTEACDCDSDLAEKRSSTLTDDTLLQAYKTHTEVTGL